MVPSIKLLTEAAAAVPSTLKIGKLAVRLKTNIQFETSAVSAVFLKVADRQGPTRGGVLALLSPINLQTSAAPLPNRRIYCGASS